MVLLNVGIDDTDSKKGMCTTYLAALILDDLQNKFGISAVDTPKLVRLNPNCPYKTRGNAALSFSLELTEDMIPEVKKMILSYVKSYSDLDQDGTDPGVVFLCGEVPESLTRFSERAMNKILTIKEALHLAASINAELHRFKYGRGVIGALAAIGCNLRDKHTFELIAYRFPERRGTRRNIDLQSVIDMDRATFPYTFDNIDYQSNEIRIAPHTPCPVLFGIRGTNKEILMKAMKMIKVDESIERYRIFITNQGTDAHIVKSNVANSEENSSVRIKGIVKSSPYISKGGHVFFELADKTGTISCAAFEPTKNFRKVVLSLVTGDEVEVYGSVKKKPGLPKTINLEKIYIHKLARITKKVNPLCPNCNSRMKSEGRSKGYQCERCKFRLKDATKQEIIIPRRVTEGLYTVPPRARRHLSRPGILEYCI